MGCWRFSERIGIEVVCMMCFRSVCVGLRSRQVIVGLVREAGLKM